MGEGREGVALLLDGARLIRRVSDLCYHVSEEPSRAGEVTHLLVQLGDLVRRAAGRSSLLGQSGEDFEDLGSQWFIDVEEEIVALGRLRRIALDAVRRAKTMLNQTEQSDRRTRWYARI